MNNRFIDVNNLKVDDVLRDTNLISEKIIIIPQDYSGLCNNIKNVLSIIRYKNKINFKFLINKKNMLNEIFDFSEEMYYNDKKINKLIYIRDSWRFALFDSDNNLDKITNNVFSLMFPDFKEYNFFKNYKNNCIDFVYNPRLFNEIYCEYSKIFDSLNIKNNITIKIDDFCKKNFNKNTISIHLRSWIDCCERQKYFDINNFYKKINELNNGYNTFFISSDNKNICYDMKQKFGDIIIIYEDNDSSNTINSFIELILLSKNNFLIGSYISTFTELAYIINYSIEKKLLII